MVSVAAVTLKSRQEHNQVLDRERNVLAVSGLTKPGETVSDAKVSEIFKNNITPKFVNLKTGKYATPDEVGVGYKQYDQRKAAASDDLGYKAPENPSRIARLPKYALIYEVMNKSGKLDKLVLPVEGYGLWGTLYGYLALEQDANTIAGLTFYEQKETPGLGGEVDNPAWKALWPGRKAFGKNGKVRIHVKKGKAGPPSQDPYAVDGISGATLTSNGVTHLLQFWLGPNGFGPFIDNYNQKKLA